MRISLIPATYICIQTIPGVVGSVSKQPTLNNKDNIIEDVSIGWIHK